MSVGSTKRLMDWLASAAAYSGSTEVAGCSASSQHLWNAWAFDGARRDRNDLDAELTEFARQCLREADEAPLRGRVRTLIRITRSARQATT